MWKLNLLLFQSRLFKWKWMNIYVRFTWTEKSLFTILFVFVILSHRFSSVIEMHRICKVFVNGNGFRKILFSFPRYIFRHRTFIKDINMFGIFIIWLLCFQRKTVCVFNGKTKFCKNIHCLRNEHFHLDVENEILW